MASYKFYFGGIEKNVQPGWSINATANGRNVFNCSIISLDGSYRPTLDADTIVNERVVVSTSSVANPSVIVTAEAHGLVDGQLILIEGHSGSTPDINGLHTATLISSTSFSIPVNVTTGGTGGTAARRIFGGNINLPTEAGLGGYGVVPITTEIEAVDYNSIAERRYIKIVLSGTPQAVYAYAFLELDTNFNNGDTVTIGTKVYTMQDVLTDVDGNVKIDGSTINQSLQNLAAAMVLADGAGTTYAASMTANVDADAVVRGNVLKAIALTAGVAGNSIAVATDHGSWYGEGGVTLVAFQNGADTSGSASTLKAALGALVAYLKSSGVTLHPDQVDGPSIPELVYDYLILRDILEQLSALTGYTWEIDEYCRLIMKSPAIVYAPINIVTGDGNAIGDITVHPNRDDYANRVIVRYSTAATYAYGFMHLDTNFPGFGDAGYPATVKLGSKTYNIIDTGTDPLDSDGDVALGGSVDDSLNNLVAAIILGAGSGSTYSATTTENSAATAGIVTVDAQTAIHAVARTAGAGGNSVSCESSWADAYWFGEGGGAISSLERGYDQSLTATPAIAEEASEQASHGIWEVIVEAADTTDSTVAQTIADAYLANKLLTPKIVTYNTYKLGLCPGQTQTINIAARDLNGTFLITDVDTVNTVGAMVLRSVTAIESLIVQSIARWRDTYKEWSGGGSSGGTGITVGGTTVVTGVIGIYAFGGSQTEWQQSATPDWVSANSIQIRIDTAVRGSVNGVCYVRIRASAGSVTARLRNVTDGSTVGTSATITDANFQTLAFAVVLTTGAKVYEVQLLPSLADTDVQLGSAYLE